MSLWSFRILKMAESVGDAIAWSLDKISHLTIGQLLIRFIDRSLNIVEKTAQWSLPYSEVIAEEDGKLFKTIELVRPLPWIFFLPSLVVLRSFRLTWNIGAWVFGYPQIQPVDIVKSMQKTRRRLRVIRLNGGKRMRKIKPNLRDRSLRINEAKRSLLKSIQITLSSLSCLDACKMKSSPSPTRVRLNTNNETEPTPVTEPLIAGVDGDFKRRFSQVSSDYSQSSDESDAEYEIFKSRIDSNASEYPSEDDDKSFKIQEDNNRELDGSDDEIPDEDEQEIQAEVEELLKDVDSIKNIVDDLEPDPQQNLMMQQYETFLEKKRLNGNEHLIKKYSEESQDYYSPKSNEDGDTAFYSPLSSKSSSPEPIDNDNDNDRPNKNDDTTTKVDEKTIKSSDQIHDNHTRSSAITISTSPKPIISHGKVYRRKKSTGYQGRSSNERGKKK
ncbi:GSCOCG00000884001-RA-CDS [Cotesia congregata]|nr:GSCOCG00000884001-RA-CDS [Cotesia congregata]